MKLSAIAGLASVAFVLILILRVDTEKPSDASDVQLVTTEITALKTRRYNGIGALLEQSQTDHLIQYDREKKTFLTGVNVTQSSADDGTWTLTAPDGIGSETNGSLELFGGVNIVNGKSVAIATDTMLISSEDRIAKSKGKVVLTTQNSETNADGLTIDLGMNTATLTGNVNTEYRSDRAP